LDPPPDDVVIVDGDVKRSAEAVVAEFDSRRPPVRYVTAEPGLTRQRNVGLDIVTTDVVVFLDDDATLDRAAVHQLREIFRSPDVAGATGPVVEPSSHGVAGQRSRLRRVIHPLGAEGTFTRYGYPRRLTDMSTRRDVEFMPGCFMAARVDVARRLRFDEVLPGYGLAEDEDFSYRLSRVGRIVFEPALAVQHANAGFAGRDRRSFGRAVVVHRHYLFRKNFPQNVWARLGFAWLIVLLLGHRLVNADLHGARGLVDGVVAVLRGAGPSAP
jgi:GT2 family glycosyltransferase